MAYISKPNTITPKRAQASKPTKPCKLWLELQGAVAVKQMIGAQS